MSKLRSVSTAFWSDPFIEELSPSEKLLYLYLITNEKTNMLGIYESSFKKISFETGIPIKTIEEAFKRFETLSKVKYIKNYVIMVNFMKHQNFNTNMMKSAIDIYHNLPNELKDSILVIDKSNPIESFETLSNHFGMVRKVEVEYELEDEKEKESKVEKPKLHLFKDSEFYDFEKFKTQFVNTVYEKADLKYYHESVMNWSASKGEKKIDWIATARGFMSRDKKEDKLQLKKTEKLQSISPTYKRLD